MPYSPNKQTYVIVAVILTILTIYFTSSILFHENYEDSHPCFTRSKSNTRYKNNKNNNNININTNNNNVNIHINTNSIKNNFNINYYNETKEYKYSPTKINIPHLRYNFDNIYEEYMEFHNCTLEQEKKGRKGKYIFVNYDNEWFDVGLGNKFPGYVTGFVLALITKRTLIVNYRGYEEFSTMIDNGLIFEKPNWLKFDKKSYKRISLSDKEYDIAVNQDLALYFKKYDVIELKTIDYPLVLLYGNPLYYDWLMENFGMNPYSIIAQRLLRPSQKIQTIVKDFKTKNFGETTIGIQIRTEKLKVKGGTELFTEISQWIRETRFSSSEKIRFFLAADQETARKEAKEILGDEIVMMEPYRARYSAESEFYAVVDILLLASCDVIVASHTSSFGAISMSYEGTETYMVYPDKTFAKLSIREPCFFGMRKVLQQMTLQHDVRNLNNPFFLAQLNCHD